MCAARTDKQRFFEWVGSSLSREATDYRVALTRFESARQNLTRSRKAAIKTFEELHKPGTGPSDGAIAKWEAR